MKSFYTKWGWLLALIFTLAFAFALRLVNFTGVLDWDAVEYTHIAVEMLQGRPAFSWSPTSSFFRIGLTLPLAMLYAAFGPSELSTVSYPLVVSLLAVLAMYAIGRLVADEKAGLLSALIWAALPLNVFLSTLFGPDGLLANFTIISVFFALLADRSSGWRRWLAALVCLFFAVLAVFVKPSAITIFVFLAAFVLYTAARRYHSRLATLAANKRLRWIVAGLALIALVTYGALQSSPFVVQVYRTSLDLANVFVLGSTQEKLPGQLFLFILLFFAFTPLFVAGLSRLFLRWDTRLTPVLLWAATLFLYFEWASHALNPLRYAPFFAALNDRNLLLIFAPFVVLAGAFLSRWLTVGQARFATLAAVGLVTPLAWFQRQAGFAGPASSLVALAAMVSIAAVFVFPFLLRGSKPHQPLAAGFVVLLLVAFLHPAPPLHMSDPYWQQQVKYRAAITQAADFLLQHPEYPVVTPGRRNAAELNWASRFQLGFAIDPQQNPSARIRLIADPLVLQSSVYLYLRDEVNLFRPPPTNWWLVAEIDSGTEEPIVIYRILSLGDAQRELLASQEAFQQSPSVASAERLLAAGVNAMDPDALLQAWSLLRTQPAQAAYFRALRPVLQEAYENGSLATVGNLFLTEPELTFSLAEDLQDSLSVSTLDGVTTVLKSDTGALEIETSATIDPGSLYIFAAEVSSTVGVDLICGDRVSQDSQEANITFDGWQHVAVLFAPENVDDSKSPVDLCLFRFQKPGQLEFRSLELYEVRSATH